MKKLRKSLNKKLLFSIVLLCVIISVVSCVIGFLQYNNTIRRLYNENGYMLGSIILEQIDGDRIAEYAQTWTRDAYYSEMEDYLKEVEEASGAAYIYMVVPYENREMRYIYDSSGMDIGDYDPISSYFDKVYAVYETGEKPEGYFVRRSQKYGYLTSSIMAVKDHNGKIAALLFVDIHMEVIVSTLAGYVLRAALICGGLLILFCMFYWLLLKRMLLKPIALIRQNAFEFANNDAQLTDALGQIQTGDELQELAQSVLTMEHAIIQYIAHVQRVTAEKERIGAELNVATQIQADMLPRIFPAFPERKEFDIYASMNPAKEVGGDFYDFFMVDDRHLAVVMADVSGKGVPAALFMVIGKTLIKDHTQLGISLGDVFSNVNNLLCDANSEGMFITAFEGILDLVTGEFTYVNAGHEIPYICRKGESFEAYKVRAGFVLAGMEDMRYKEGSVKLAEGDRIYLYTDGVPEATNADNEMYGSERLLNILNKHKDKTPENLLMEIKADVDRFVEEAPQFDDITMLCLEYKEPMQIDRAQNV